MPDQKIILGHVLYQRILSNGQPQQLTQGFSEDLPDDSNEDTLKDHYLKRFADKGIATHKDNFIRVTEIKITLHDKDGLYLKQGGGNRYKTIYSAEEG